ncbi:MAG: hypothetical protein LBM69_04440 [Lachnospiraceae bacterium]|jgi:hypothetical protein|nr:hypothetical protein [Lachnospiraceae bacterium]
MRFNEFIKLKNGILFKRACFISSILGLYITVSCILLRLKYLKYVEYREQTIEIRNKLINDFIPRIIISAIIIGLFVVVVTFLLYLLIEWKIEYNLKIFPKTRHHKNKNEDIESLKIKDGMKSRRKFTHIRNKYKLYRKTILKAVCFPVFLGLITFYNNIERNMNSAMTYAADLLPQIIPDIIKKAIRSSMIVTIILVAISVPIQLKMKHDIHFFHEVKRYFKERKSSKI